jgi:hypothetical protein
VAELVALQVADPPDLWRQLGFTVAGTTCAIGSVEHQLGAEGTGVVGWVVDGLTGFDEVPTAAATARSTPPTEHPNGVLELDHVVVATPDLARTIAAFEAAGVGLRRTRQAGAGMTQAFFKLGPMIIEVIGHPTAADDGPATFWGLTFTVADLDATAALLGTRLRPIKTAVQAGRRIGTLDRAAGSSVPIAFMSTKG